MGSGGWGLCWVGLSVIGCCFFGSFDIVFVFIGWWGVVVRFFFVVSFIFVRFGVGGLGFVIVLMFVNC